MPDQPIIARGGRYIILAIGLVVLVLILWRIRDVAIVTFGGVIVAVLLRGVALPLSRKTNLSEAYSLVIALVSLGILIALFGWFFGSQTANEIGQMQRLIPEALTRLKNSLQGSTFGQPLLEAIKHTPADAKFISGMGIAAGAMLGGLADFLLMVFLGIYFAFSPRVYIEGFLYLIPPLYRDRVGRALVDAGDALRKWLVVQFYAMIIIGVLVGVTLAIIGVPLALLLGVIAGLLEFIPVVGPLLFTAPALLVAFTQGPTTVFYVLLVYCGLQQIESNFITPLLQRWAFQLPLRSLYSLL